MDCGLCIYYWTGSSYVLWRTFCDPGCFCNGAPQDPPANPDETGYAYVDCVPAEATTTPAPTTTPEPTTTTTGEPTTTTTGEPTTTTTGEPTTSTTTTAPPAECMIGGCLYRWDVEREDFVLVSDTCAYPCSCTPQSLILRRYGHNYNDPNEEIYLPCVKPSIAWKELAPPYRGCLYGVIYRQAGTYSFPPPPTTPSPYTYTAYWCDYGDPVRRAKFAEFFELLFDGCDGTCPDISLRLEYTTNQEAEALRTTIREFLLQNFPDPKNYRNRSADDFAYSWVYTRVFVNWTTTTNTSSIPSLPFQWFYCPNRMYCLDDEFIPYVPGTIVSSVTLPPGNCCCPGAGTTPPPGEYDPRFYPNSFFLWDTLRADFTNEYLFPRGWVISGDYYVDSNGLHCTDPAGCFVFPCVFYESILNRM